MAEDVKVLPDVPPDGGGGGDGGRTKHSGKPSGCETEVPLAGAGMFSFLTYAWMDPFMWRAFRRGVTQEDVWKCSAQDGALLNAHRLETMWQDELKSRGPDAASLSRVFITFVKKRLIIGTLLLLVSLACLMLTTCYFLLSVLRYASRGTEELWYGLILVAALFLADVLQNVLFICVFTITHSAGARLRGGAILMIYKKLLTIDSLRDKTSGMVVNLLANDSGRIFEGVSYLPMLLVAPLLCIASTAYAMYLLGPWPLIGFVILLLLFPIMMCIGKIIMMLREKAIVATDKRVRMMGEILTNIKFLKMYAWETPYSNILMGIRQKERSILEKVNLATSMVFSVSTVVVSMATISTIMVYTLTGHDLTPATAFTYLAVFSSIQGKLMLSTMAVKSLSEFKVAAERMQGILMLRSKSTRPMLAGSSVPNDSHNVVEFKSASLSWPVTSLPEGDIVKLNGSAKHENGSKKNEDHGTEMKLLPAVGTEENDTQQRALYDISLKVESGDVVGVAGSVGAGKTALISAFLGQLQLMEGDIVIRGRLAYVPQQPWIFNASLRENILFGLPYNEQKYNSVIEACCLCDDLDAFGPAGDTTEIGERGVNLSGGQKQRISLARAVYSDRDIILLDDPFSAVDPDIADRLFNQVVQNTIVGKTILLVTHQVKYLSNCDYIVYMRDGQLVETGTHDELMDLANGEYAQFFKNIEDQDLRTMDVASSRLSISEKEVDFSQDTKKNDGVDRQLSKTPAQRLVSEEEKSVGAVRWQTYLTYIRASGGVIVTILVFVLFLLAEGSKAFNYWWLAIWIGKGSGNTTITIGNKTVISRSISDNPHLRLYNLVYGLSLVVTLVFLILRGYIFTKAAMRGSSRIHGRLLQTVLRCPMRFFDTTPLGRVINRFSKDMDDLDSQLPPLIDQTLQSVLAIVLYLIMIGAVIHWFLIAVTPLAVVFVFVYVLFRGGSRDLQRLQNMSVSPMLSHLTATIQGLPSVYAYEKVEEFTDRFVQMTDHNSVTLLLFNLSMRWINLRLSIVTTCVVCLTALLIVILPDNVKPEYAGLAIVYALQLSTLFQFFVRMAVETEAKFTAVERINTYITNLESENEPMNKNYQPHGTWPADGHVTFHEYSMRYREGLPLVLKGISCEIKPGEKVGIVGRTGSGKSSLASALFKLVEPESGHIEIDGIDINRIGYKDLRSKLSSIPQDPVLFAGSVRSNLDPMNRNIDLEMWRALEKCHMKKTINNLDMKLDSAVMEHGSNFSVGEQQLLSIARVLLRHSKIIVLDEATAAIDSETDLLIQASLKQVFSESTVLIIAHRLSTVLQLDRVIVMDDGKIVEFDKPSILLADNSSKFSQLMAVVGDSSVSASQQSLDNDAWV